MATVSIILPVFNRLRFLRLTLASVEAQTCRDWEIVIADDGSDAETIAYLDSVSGPQIRVIRLAHSGNPARVRNAAIAAATGRYLAFLDSDDLWEPTKLEKQLAALKAHPECRWSYTSYEHIDEDGRTDPWRLIPVRSGWIFEPLLKLEAVVPMPTLLAEASLVREVGGFEDAQVYGEFHDLALRLSLRAQVWPVDEALCLIRRHTEHFDSDPIAFSVGWMRLYEKMRALAPTPPLKAYCAWMRAETSLRLLASQIAARQIGASGSVLVQSLPFSWSYPRWWFGLAKVLARAMGIRRRSRQVPGGNLI
jgi:glycosyltransferase involved in cell wall biosynthesis